MSLKSRSNGGKGPSDTAFKPRVRVIADPDAKPNPDPPHLNSDGSIRHPNRVGQADWRDPEDATALEQGPDGKRHQRTIKGYRVQDPLARLPCGPEHHKAAQKLRNDWERGSGARSGGPGGDPMERVDITKGQSDAIASVMEARRRYEDAVTAIGQRAAAVALPVVLAGWTVADLIEKHGGNPMSLQGRVMAALDRLSEHYFGSDAEPFVVPAPVLLDPSVTDVPQSRLGRVRSK